MFELQYITTMMMDFIRQDEVFKVVMLPIFLAASFILPWLLLLFAHKTNKSRNYSMSLVEMKTNDIYKGITYVSGTVESRSPLVSYLSETPCVWYSYHVQEQQKKTIRTPYIDINGKKRIKRRTVYEWAPLYADEDSCPFYLHDDSGKIQVDPLGALVEGVQSLHVECGIEDPMFFDKGPDGIVSHSTHKRRFVEDLIPLGQNVSVLGEANDHRHNESEIIISNSKDHEHYLISIHSREEYLKKKTRKTRIYLFLGFLLAGIPFSFFLFTSDLSLYEASKLPVSGLAILAYLSVACHLWLKTFRNRLRTMKSRTTKAFEQLEYLLEEKQSLIPELYKVASYYSIFDSMTGRQQLNIQNSLEKGELSFDDLLDQFPELSTGRIFLPLNNKLKQTNQQIHQAERAYDVYADSYNKTLNSLSGKVTKLLYGIPLLPLSYEIDKERFKPFISHKTSSFSL